MFGAVDGLVTVSSYSAGVLWKVDWDSDSPASLLSVADFRVTFEVIFLNKFVLTGLLNSFNHTLGFLGLRTNSSRATGAGSGTFRVDATTSVH